MWVAVCVLWVVLIPLSLSFSSLSSSLHPSFACVCMTLCLYFSTYVCTWSEFLGFSLNHSSAILCHSVSSNLPIVMSIHFACFCIHKQKPKKSTIASWEKYPHSYCLRYNHTPQLVPVITNFTIYGVALVWPARPTPTLPLLLNLKTISWRRERGSSWPEQRISLPPPPTLENILKLIMIGFDERTDLI